MSSLGWLDVSRIDFYALLLLEPLHVQYISQREPDQSMGIVLQAYPAVVWYLRQTYPPIAPYIEACLELADPAPTPSRLRAAEIEVLDSMQDWLIYLLEPEKYDQLAFLSWDDASLLGMTDFQDKTVLDVGAGTGRLAFAAAPLAKAVFAIEPVANLRRYLWKKRAALGIDNVYPLDGLITQIPLPENCADILMAGHVFGDALEEEYQEMVRVVKDGGMILLHPGTNADTEDDAHRFLLSKGFYFDIFTEPGDGPKRKYWKSVEKLH